MCALSNWLYRHRYNSNRHYNCIMYFALKTELLFVIFMSIFFSYIFWLILDVFLFVVVFFNKLFKKTYNFFYFLNLVQLALKKYNFGSRMVQFHEMRLSSLVYMWTADRVCVKTTIIECLARLFSAYHCFTYIAIWFNTFSFLLKCYYLSKFWNSSILHISWNCEIHRF